VISAHIFSCLLDQVMVGLAAALQLFLLVRKHYFFDGDRVLNLIFAKGDFKDMVFLIFRFYLILISRLHYQLNGGLLRTDEISMQTYQIDQPTARNRSK